MEAVNPVVAHYGPDLLRRAQLNVDLSVGVRAWVRDSSVPGTISIMDQAFLRIC
jgi:hypothetical protein